MRGVEVCPFCDGNIIDHHEVATRLVKGKPARVHRACQEPAEPKE